MKSILAALTLAAASPARATRDSCSAVAGKDKVDCGVVGTNQPECEGKGCCWQPAPSGSAAPWCFYKSGAAPTCPLEYSSKGAPFSDEEVTTMRAFFLNNINVDGSGAVVAAPDYNTPGGSYYFHWERDGALSMQALLRTADSVAGVKTQMDAYVGWVGKVQQETDPHGQSVLAEPKYMIPNGSVFAGGWCRPQNDGPGLRSHTLIDYATALAEEGNADAGSKYSPADLWALIKIDLDWQAANWQQTGCDLWEEIRSDDFFWNRFTMRAALTKGAAFAKLQCDDTRASIYAGAAQAVEATLGEHFANGFVFETQSRQKDAAVICAFNDGYLGDGVFAPTSEEVAGTVSTLNELFCSTFAINQNDTAAGLPGILYGRYQGDNYAGGNPWILLTSALAELLYSGATEIAQSNGAALTAAAQAKWADALGLAAGHKARVGGAELDMADAMAGAGDGVLTRLRHHVVDNGFHLNEQIDRNTGVSMAAKDLTWSYATTLKAVHKRSQYVALREAMTGNQSSGLRGAAAQEE
jgi:glucoamylase